MKADRPATVTPFPHSRDTRDMVVRLTLPEPEEMMDGEVPRVEYPTPPQEKPADVVPLRKPRPRQP